MQKKTDVERKEIIRRDWEKYQVKRSWKGFILSLLVPLLLIGLMIIALGGSLSFLFSNNVSGSVLILISLIAFGIIALFISLIDLIGFLNVSYILQSGSLRKIAGEYTDQITGKVIVTKGILSKHTEVYLASEMDRVEVVQGLVGRLLGYGSIKLKETDMLQETGSFQLRMVNNPQDVAMLIQDMIDVQGQRGSQVQ